MKQVCENMFWREALTSQGAGGPEQSIAAESGLRRGAGGPAWVISRSSSLPSVFTKEKVPVTMPR